MKKTIVIALAVILLATCAKKETSNKDDFVMDGTVLVKYKGNAANVTIPEGVISIGDYAFSECYSLTSIIIPSNVTSIGDWAFERCANLSNLTIPSSVTIIGESAFSRCLCLTSITIPSSVISIGDFAFNGCDKLRTVVVSKKTTIGEDAFPDGVQITYSD